MIGRNPWFVGDGFQPLPDEQPLPFDLALREIAVIQEEEDSEGIVDAGEEASEAVRD